MLRVKNITKYLVNSDTNDMAIDFVGGLLKRRHRRVSGLNDGGTYVIGTYVHTSHTYLHRDTLRPIR